MLPAPYDPVSIQFAFQRSYASAHETRDDDTLGDPAVEKAHDQIRSRLRERREASIAAGTAGAAVAFDFIDAFGNVDATLLAGVSDVYNQPLTSLSDLSQHLQGVDVSPGLVAAVKGHMAEHVLAEHLGNLGVPVELAPSPFQEGWDLTIDGIPVNPKLYSDAAQLAEHFSRFPDIPAVLPADALNIPPDAIHFDSITGAGVEEMRQAIQTGADHLTLVDGTLSHTDITQHASNGLAVATSPASVAGFNFPWVALALSGWREGSLLKRGMTEPAVALKNMSLDLAGTGGGAWLGAKTGAGIGSLVGPVGTAIGALLGGIGGALLGRKVTSDIKAAPYKTALTRLHAAQALILQAEEQRVEQTFNHAKEHAQGRMQLRRERVKARIVEVVADARRAHRQTRVLSGEEALDLINQGLAGIADHRESIVASRRARSIWRRWIWPDAAIIGSDLAVETLDTAKAILVQQRSHVADGETLSRAEVYAHLGSLGLAEFDVREALFRIESEKAARRIRLEAVARKGLRELTRLRKVALAAIQRAIERALAETRKKLAPKAAEAAAAHDNVRREAGRLGLSPASRPVRFPLSGQAPS